MRGLDEEKLNWRMALGPLMDDRRADLELTWADVAERSGVTTQALRDIREKPGGMRKLTKRGIEKALAWEPGSVDRILAGELPIEDHAAWPPEIHSVQILGETVTATDAFTVRRLPNWFTSELARRSIAIDDVLETLKLLRSLAEHNQSTLGELLLEAGLASPDELAIGVKDDPVTQFRREYERIKASPHLSRAERKALDKQYQDVLSERGEGSEDA